MAASINNIPDLINTPSESVERFLPLSGICAQPLLDIGICLSGISSLVPPYFMKRKAEHDEHVIVFTLGGRAWFCHDSGEGTVGPGDLLICPAHREHQYRPDPVWECCWFHMREIESWGFLEGAPVNVVQAQFADRLQLLMDGYIVESTLSAVESTVAALSYARLIAAYLRREFQFMGDAQGQGVLYQLWMKVLSELHRPWCVEDMAAIAHCSVPTLYRLVAKHHGERPMEVLTRMRMQRVKELLERSDYTLAEIASRVGYASPYALSRVYKRVKGHSPEGDRRRG